MKPTSHLNVEAASENISQRIQELAGREHAAGGEVHAEWQQKGIREENEGRKMGRKEDAGNEGFSGKGLTPRRKARKEKEKVGALRALRLGVRIFSEGRLFAWANRWLVWRIPAVVRQTPPVVARLAVIVGKTGLLACRVAAVGGYVARAG